ncbi:MAG: DUF3098 domain-containing protein [Flavobacteriaceae bacterium]|nr:DUF3098 domain-containing protein [Flavobacteriaceae bacterium]
MGKRKPKQELLFGKRNYQFFGLALILIAVGFALMSGGGSSDPEIFNPMIYNFQRIRLAPTIVLLGFGIAIYSVLIKPSK